MGGLFDGKVAIVTGGATGIGRAACLGFAAGGAKVVVADINEAEAAETVKLVGQAGGQALFVRTDVTAAADIAHMVETTVKAFGRLDAAFNNAGTPGGFTNLVDCTETEWDQVMTLNLKSVWLCMKHEIPAMIASGGGAIVNTASNAALWPAPHMVTYDTSKAALIGLTRSAARDYVNQNIRANVLCPGVTLTPMLRRGAGGLETTLDGFASTNPMGRLGRPEEQADTAVWLCSPQASFITGLAISCDGGANLV